MGKVLIRTAVSFLALAGLALGAAFFQAAPSGLAGYWKLDETTGTTSVDSSDNAFNGTFGASPTAPVINPTPGLTLNVPNPACLTFDGTDDRVTVPNNAALQFGPAANFTLSVWARPASTTRNVWQGVVTKSREAAPWYGLWISNGNQWVFGGPANITGPALVDTNWHHLALVQNLQATPVRTMYLDGTSVATGGAQDAAGTGTLMIGGSGGVTEFFQGQVDEVRIYNRALTTAEITYLSSRNAVPVAPLNLMAVPGTNQVSLTWNPTATTAPNPSPAGTVYNVKRSQTSGTGYATISPAQAGTTFTDTPLTPGTYYYVVTAVNVGGESAISAQATATVAVPPPPPPRTSASGNEDDRCGCGTTTPSLHALLAALAATALLLFALKR